MPRKRKIETGHDKVVPLSLPDVQLCVANSINGDTINEEVVHRALQGYQLVLQGSLRDSAGIVTRDITGHAGYYRNLMRGVANVFGVERRDNEEPIIVRGAYISDENDDFDMETFDTDSTAPAAKRRATSRTQEQPDQEGKVVESKSKGDSVFAGIQPKPPEVQLGNLPSARERDESVHHPPSEHGSEFPTGEPAPLEKGTIPTTDPNVSSTADPKESHTISPITEPSRSHVPFNRYKGKPIVAPSSASPVLHGTENSHSSKTAKEQSPASHATVQPVQQTGTSTDIVESKNLSDTADVPTVTDELGKRGEAEKVLADKHTSHQIEMSVVRKDDDEQAQPETIQPAPNLQMEKSTMISLHDNKVVTDESLVKKPVQDEQYENRDRDVNDEDSPFETDKAKNVASSKPSGTASEALESSSPPAPSLKDFPKDITPSFFESFIDKEFDLEDNVRIFSQYDATIPLERSLLPGTWMMNHKALRAYDFKYPQTSAIYGVIRRMEPQKSEESVRRYQWQLIVFKGLSNYCKAIVKEEDFDVNDVISVPSVFVFDSTSLGISPEVVLFARNFCNGVIRKSLYESTQRRNLKKKELDRIKSLVKTLSSNIVLVHMPSQPTPKYSGPYLLSNMKYIFAKENMSNAFTYDKDENMVKTSTQRLRLGPGKSKITSLVTITLVDRTTAYDEDLF